MRDEALASWFHPDCRSPIGRAATQHLITENVLRPRLLSVQQGSLKGVAPVHS